MAGFFRSTGPRGDAVRVQSYTMYNTACNCSFPPYPPSWVFEGVKGQGRDRLRRFAPDSAGRRVIASY